MYSAIHVANSVLSAHWDNDEYPSISPMKLQKLMYFTHGWHLAVHDQPVVYGGFRAWPRGPVNRETYHQFKRYRQRPISQLAAEYDNDGNQVAYVVAYREVAFYEVLNMVMDKYGRLPALQLSALTHSSGSPWHQAKMARQDHIDDDLIKRHYIDLAKSKDVLA